MGELQTVLQTQYTDYTTALSDKRYRDVDLASNITLRGAIQLALYNSAALANDSTNMAAALAELEVIYEESITPPAFIISGLESEAASQKGVAVTAGIVNSITFPISLSSINYALFIESYDSSGNFVSYKRYGLTVSGFSIEVADNGFIDYRAILV